MTAPGTPIPRPSVVGWWVQKQGAMLAVEAQFEAFLKTNLQASLYVSTSLNAFLTSNVGASLAATVSRTAEIITGVLDNFNRANNSTLGSNWTNRQGTWGITSNQAYPTGSDSTTHVTTFNTSLTNDNQTVNIIAGGVTSSPGDIILLYLGGNSTGQTVYAVWYNQTDGDLEIGTISSGWSYSNATAQATLANYGLYTTGDRLTLKRIGNVYTLHKNNGASVLSWIDTANVVPRDSNHRIAGMGSYKDVGSYRRIDGWEAWNIEDQAAPQYVSSNSVEADTMTLPTHQAGDDILMFAFRDGSTTPPTRPGDWTALQSGGGSTCSSASGYKTAASSSETCGTWTNATLLVCGVYRGGSAIGVSNRANGNGPSIVFPSATMQNQTGTSLLVLLGGHRSVNGTAPATTNNGLSRRRAHDGTNADGCLYDSGGGYGTCPGDTAAGSWTSSGYEGTVVEIKK